MTRQLEECCLAAAWHPFKDCLVELHIQETWPKAHAFPEPDRRITPQRVLPMLSNCCPQPSRDEAVRLQPRCEWGGHMPGLQARREERKDLNPLMLNDQNIARALLLG